MHHLLNFLFFGVLLLYYINLNSSIICCLSCGYIYIYIYNNDLVSSNLVRKSAQ